MNKTNPLEELAEVEETAQQWLKTDNFVPPTLFLVGTKSRLGYTFVALPDVFDEQTKILVREAGKQTDKEHPEVGQIIRAYAALLMGAVPRDKKSPARELLLIHGMNIADNEQQAITFEVFRDEHMTFKSFKQLPMQYPIPEHPVLQNFVESYNLHYKN